MRDLTINQERFIQELIKGKSQRLAYRKAYPRSKTWKDKTVDEAASRLFNNSKVNTRYKRLKDKLIKRTEEEAIITAKEIIEEIVSIAKDDIGNYLSFRTEKVIDGYDKDGEPIIGYRVIVDIKDSDSIDTKNISEVGISSEGTFKFKMYKRDVALYKLVEMFGIDKIKEAKQRLAEDRFEEEKSIHNKKYW